MRLLLAAVSICLLSSCAGLADSIRKHNQKKQIYQQYSAKYYAACQKEAFSYYPVAIVKREKPQVVTPKPNTSFSCTKWGNTVDCQDTTSGGYEGLIQAVNEGVDMLAGKTNTYDANAGARGNHIKSCIDSNLRNDSQFIRATNSVNASHSSRKLPLVRQSEVNGALFCYYGFEEKLYKADFVCPESLRVGPEY